MPLTIKIVSDMHHETLDQKKDVEPDLSNPNHVDVLILAGDIFRADQLQKQEQMRAKLNVLCQNFPHVIYVAGNHEHYKGEYHKTLAILKTVCSNFPNLHFLEQQTVKIANYVFIGTTLWTNMNNGDKFTVDVVRDRMNDYNQITFHTMSVHNKPVYRKLHPLDTRRLHQQAIKFVGDTVDANPLEQYIVVTHHAPHVNSIHPIYKDDFYLNHAFYTDLTTFICDRPQIVLWAHGHIHHASDYIVPGANTRVVCNPVGYPPSLSREITGFNNDLVLCLPFL